MAPAIVEKLADKLHLRKSKKTEFDPKLVTVIFVLGGPGAGKGTQSERIVKEFNFCHLSAGDLLRAEQDRAGSEYGDLIRDNIKEGKIVPSHVTVKLLENAMRSALGKNEYAWTPSGHGRFLVDGFPRQMDQAKIFDDDVCPSALTLFYDCTEEVMLERLLERGKTSGRADDNAESIKKRFNTYRETTRPVIDHYASIGKVEKIDATRSVDEVYESTRLAVENLLSNTEKQTSA